MKINWLEVNRLRNISAASLQFHPQYNVLAGPNGSGKTSVLEAIHLLSSGRSFRATQVSPVIQYDQPDLIVRAGWKNEPGTLSQLAIQRDRQGEMTVKLNGDNLPRLADLASLLPLQLLNPDSYQLLNAGPSVRRKFLDWGLFHVEPSFLPLWQRYHRVLRQRNAALKQRAEPDAWDALYAELGEALSEQRKQYAQQVGEEFSTEIEKLLDIEGIELRYSSGWRQDEPLIETLKRHYARDLALGSSQNGPHRGDLQLYYKGNPLEKLFSRGQQKVVVYALLIARGTLLQAQTGKRCIYLVDDVASELDERMLGRVLQALQQSSSQCFITAIDARPLAHLLSETDHRMFHVEHGEIAAVDALALA